MGRSERLVRLIGAQCQREAERCGCTDERRAAHLHRPNRLRRILCRSEEDRRARMRQPCLVEHLHTVVLGRGTKRLQVGSEHAIRRA